MFNMLSNLIAKGYYPEPDAIIQRVDSFYKSKRLTKEEYLALRKQIEDVYRLQSNTDDPLETTGAAD